MSTSGLYRNMNGSETEAKAVAVLFSESIYVVTTE